MPELTEKQKAIEWFINKIRRRMLDFPELNELIGREEVGDEEIRGAVGDTISEFNDIPPPIGGFTLNNFPSQEILVTGTIYKLLNSGALLHYRNQLSYSAGGITVDTHSMGPAYERLSERLYAKFMQMSMEKKKSINVKRMLRANRGLGSDYGLMCWYNSYIDNWC